ncbi:MAG: UDP-2,3-diacylglucosamine diphosphatase [Gemmatimonadota bacterium]|nr:UDP-2,3-diacylglucosamine diphosphatase [Gemmatimonadota bacterium]
MTPRPVYVTSDVHLGAVPPDTERSFLRWLEHAGACASSLLLNGDLFDFWFEYRNAVPRGHTRVLGALRALVDAGLPITLMGGNHDWWGGSFLRDEIGVEFLQEPVVRELGGHRTLVAHGDGLGGGDLGYRALKLVLRGRFTVAGFRWLHPDVGAWLARRVSRTGSREHAADAATLARAEHVRMWAHAQLDADPTLDLVLLGHTHLPALEEVAPGRHYLNAGDWVYRRTYAILAEGEAPRLLDWEG